MADREVTADVIINDKSKPGLDSAAKNVDAAGKKIKDTLKRTGDEGGVDLGEGVARRLASFAQRIGDVAAGVGIKAGQRIGDNVANAIGSASPQVNAALTGVVTAAAVTVAPLLGAALAGAVTGGAAGTGIIGGILLAARDPRVRGAAQLLGNTVLSTLTFQANVFVGPVLQSIQMIQDRFNRLRPEIQRIFNATARYVTPLVDALLDAGEAITGSIANAGENAGPIILALGDGIRQVGEAVAWVINRMATLGPESASAFRVLFTVIEWGIKAVGAFVYVLADLWGRITTLGGLLGEDDGAGVEKLGQDMLWVAAATPGATNALNAFGSAATNAADATNYLARSARDYGVEAIALDQAEINLANAINATKEAREKGTTVTNAERQSLINLFGSIQSLLGAYSDTGVSQEQLAAKNNELYNSFVAQARSVGYTESAARDLARQYGLIPMKVETVVKESGAARAAEAIRRVRQEEERVDRTIDIAIRVTGSPASRQAIQAALNKQNGSADRAALAFGTGEHAYARTMGNSGFGRLAGAESRARPMDVNVHSRFRIELDGRPLAAEQYKITRRAIRDERWREEVGTR